MSMNGRTLAISAGLFFALLLAGCESDDPDCGRLATQGLVTQIAKDHSLLVSEGLQNTKTYKS